MEITFTSLHDRELSCTSVQISTLNRTCAVCVEPFVVIDLRERKKEAEYILHITLDFVNNTLHKTVIVIHPKICQKTSPERRLDKWTSIRWTSIGPLLRRLQSTFYPVQCLSRMAKQSERGAHQHIRTNRHLRHMF